MRLLSLFLAFYFVCLSCITCADGAVACSSKPQTTATAAAHSDRDRHSPSDGCSPLCQCRCCGGAVALLSAGPALVQVPELARPAARCHRALVVASPTPASGAVWQPPQAQA